jgi:hypothetical protein
MVSAPKRLVIVWSRYLRRDFVIDEQGIGALSELVVIFRSGLNARKLYDSVLRRPSRAIGTWTCVRSVGVGIVYLFDRDGVLALEILVIDLQKVGLAYAYSYSCLWAWGVR